MSYAIDVNILLYASDSASPYCEKARRFLDACASGSEVCCLAWPTVMGYLRIATHPSVFSEPLSPEEAMRNVQSLIELPHIRLLGEEEGFWAAYVRAARGLALRGNQVPDAHLAAILLQHDVRRLYTNDADFRRFDFLEIRNPLE